ncbi:MAG: hypothetical protein KatS3mg105_2610 [Gemmatales bacterium]|nr:MAG: hypothetical protein KatS3mg105_2610 [Gemmatales bacterium]
MVLRTVADFDPILELNACCRISVSRLWIRNVSWQIDGKPGKVACNAVDKRKVKDFGTRIDGNGFFGVAYAAFRTGVVYIIDETWSNVRDKNSIAECY